MLRTGLQMSLLALVVGLLLWRESRQAPGARLEEAFAEGLAHAGQAVHRQLERLGWAQTPAAAPVTLIGISDAALQAHAWPWTPVDYSLYIRAALPQQPAVLAIVPVLNWDRSALPPQEQQKLPQYERMLQDYLRQTPKLLLGEQLTWPEDPDVVCSIIPTPLLRRVTGPLAAIPEWTGLEDPVKEEFRAIGQIGYTNLPEDPAGTSAVPLVVRYRGQLVPTLALQAIILWQGTSLDEITVAVGSHIQVGSLRVPIDAAGRLRVNWQAPLAQVSFDELLLAAEQLEAKQKPVVPLGSLHHGVALLARTDAAARTVALPSGARRSPGELFAAAVATMQSGLFVQRVPTWFDLAVLLAAMGLCLGVPRWPRRWVAWGGLVLLVVYALLAVWVFATAQVWLPLVLPAGLVLFITVYRFVMPKPTSPLRRPIIL